jgi:hypothetical protein
MHTVHFQLFDSTHRRWFYRTIKYVTSADFEFDIFPSLILRSGRMPAVVYEPVKNIRFEDETPKRSCNLNHEALEKELQEKGLPDTICPDCDAPLKGAKP